MTRRPESTRSLRRAVASLAEQEADLRSQFRTGDPFAEALAEFARNSRIRAEAELERRQSTPAPPSGALFEE